MREQCILRATEDYAELDRYFAENQVQKLLLVCDDSIRFLQMNEYFEHLRARAGVQVVRFTDFKPNPLYKSVVAGVDRFKREQCDAIVAVGGGSAMDVAKCIKLFSNMDDSINYLQQPIVANDVKLLAVPTTAGTGSEATRYAVIYYGGEKQSITDCSCIPETVLMDSSVLRTLPIYQKKSTMLDALCHAIESFWSVNSTDESKEYSQKAIRMVMENMEGYLANDDGANANMLMAAHMAGKAINISQTTAGHAMCYKLTSLFGVAHGHAAALCDRKLYPWMIENTDKCIDPRGERYLQDTLARIGRAMGCDTARAAAEKLGELFASLELDVPTATEEQYAALRTSVNPVRLKNHPVQLTEETIDLLYRAILR